MIFRRSPEARSYERIHTRLSAQWLVHADEKRAVIAFTSRIPGEGVSTTVAGLARAFGAADPGGVLVLDAARGRRRVARYLRTKAKPVALDALEADGLELSSKVTHVRGGRVNLLPLAHDPGHGEPDTSRARRILETLKQRYRTVLIDAGALSGAGGAGWLASSDYRVLVVDAGQATREILEHHAKQLASTGIRLDGSILNKRPDYIPRFLYSLAR